MLAAAAAAERGARVMLLERNEALGKKLRITGKGRCNITNDCSVDDALDSVTAGSRFLQSAMNGFTPRDTMRLFESLGVPLKTERGFRVFPESDKASDVAEALRRYLDKTNVTLMHGRARGIDAPGGRVTGVRTYEAQVKCSAVILATGGMSYPATGSTGDGYKIARELGHTVTPLRGSLVPLEADPGTCAKLQGLTLKNVRISLFDGGGRPLFEDFGELLFTHFGISGPLALSASAHLRDFSGSKYYALVDMKPALDEKKLDMRVQRDFIKYANRDFANSLGDLLSKSMIPVIVEKSGIAPDMKTHSVTRSQRMGIVRMIKALRIDIDRPRPIEEAIVTSGGIDLKEVNPKTMGSKLVEGLFFAGEIIDADAYTGGFNLQIAWSTAYAAAKGAAEASEVSL